MNCTINAPVSGRKIASFPLAVLGTIASQVGIFGGSIMYSAVLARQLHPSGRGEYALISIFHALVSTVALFGLDYAGTFHLANGRAKPQVALGYSLIFTTGSALGALAISAGVFWFWSELLPGTGSVNLALGIAIVPFELLILTQQGLLLAQQQVVCYNRGLVGRTVVTVVAGMVFASLGRLTVWKALAADLAGFAASGIFMFLSARRFAGGVVMQPKLGYIKSCLRFGFAVYLCNVLQLVHIRFASYLLGNLHGAATVGIYSVAQGVSEKLLSLCDRTSTLLFPRVALSSDQKAIGAWSAAVLRMTLLVMAACSAVLFLFADKLVVAVFGLPFRPSVLPLRMLLVGNVCLAGANLITSYLNGVNRPMLAAYSVLIATTVNIGLLLCWVPNHGAQGAALSTLVSSVVMLGANAILMSMQTGLQLRSILIPTGRDAAALVRYFAAARGVAIDSCRSIIKMFFARSTRLHPLRGEAPASQQEGGL